MKKIFLFLLCLFLLLVLYSCSSVPKNKEPAAVVDVKNKAAEYATFGDNFFAQSQFDQALKFFEMALKENISVNNETGIVKSFNSIGKVYSAQNLPVFAEDSFSQAYDLSLRISDPALTAQCENNLGEAALRKGDTEKALEFFNKGINRLLTDTAQEGKRKKTDTEGQDNYLAVLYHNVGLAYKLKKDYIKADEFLQKALLLNTEMDKYRDMADNYYALASVWSKKGEYAKASEYALLALTNDKRVENSPGIAKDFLALGIISEKNSDIKKAYEYYKDSYFVYKTLNITSEMKKLLGYLIGISKKLGLPVEEKNFTTLLKALEEG